MRAAAASAAPRSCGRRALREPHHPRVVAEVGVPQLGVPVEPERADDAAVERAHEEVGKEVRAGLRRQRLLHLVESEHVVAGVAAQPLDARAGDHLIERPPVPQSANATARRS